jgi:Protein of unknown function DUF262
MGQAMNDFDEDEIGNEDETDLSPLRDEDLAQAIVNATDWTIETILSQINKGNILLDPKFQRRDAWKKTRKSEFIESLMLGLPVPQIVLASHQDRKGKYIIIDGKQRLLSIRQFASRRDDEIYEELRLTGLNVKSEFNGNSLQMLKANPAFLDDVNAFENETIRTVVIKYWPNEEFLYRVFLRLNTNSVGLSPQELRQALHPGPFIDFAENYTQADNPIREILKTTKPDFRMRDVEILIRYYAFRFFIHDYAGSMKHFLDHTCLHFNEHWNEAEQVIVAEAQQLGNAHQTTVSIFGANAYRKWNGDKYETRFNRAIFDIMAYYFGKPEIRERVAGFERQIEAAFKDICTNNQAFLASIERTTKSINATATRLNVWAIALNAVLTLDIPVLRAADNRIV